MTFIWNKVYLVIVFYSYGAMKQYYKDDVWMTFGLYTHTHTHTYMYIYIYLGNISSFRHIDWAMQTFFCIYFCIYSFKLPYRSHDIPLELVNKPSIINCFLGTISVVLVHHRGWVFIAKAIQPFHIRYYLVRLKCLLFLLLHCCRVCFEINLLSLYDPFFMCKAFEKIDFESSANVFKCL